MFYKSQAARDAQAANYGNKTYWDYLEQYSEELFNRFLVNGDLEIANKMMSRSLSEALIGNDGE